MNIHECHSLHDVTTTCNMIKRLISFYKTKYTIFSVKQGSKGHRYTWHSASSLGWPFPMRKYYYICQISNFIKQHSETVMLWNYQNADCSLRKNFYRVIYYNFRHTFVTYMYQKNSEKNLECLAVETHTLRSHCIVLQSRRRCAECKTACEMVKAELTLACSTETAC